MFMDAVCCEGGRLGARDGLPIHEHASWKLSIEGERNDCSRLTKVSEALEQATRPPTV